MTKSSVAISRTHCCVNLHEFLKSKRRIVKYAKKTVPNSNGSDNLKRDRFDPLSIKELHGLSWIGDCLFRKRGSEIIFLAKNKEQINPNNSELLPKEIIVKSSPVEFCSSLQHERNLLSNFTSCNNIVHCYGDEITTTNSGQRIYNVLLEYCSGSSLRDHMINYGLHGLPECEVRRYARDIVHGLYYMHCHARYIHGDIKPRNILLSPNDRGSDCLVAKISSFGSARKLTREILCDDEICGSDPYTSPEVARDGYLDWPADVWALGCVVLEMLMGKLSFQNKYELGCCYDKELPKIPKEISNVGKDFMKKCLIRSPYMRKPIWLLIKHPFVCL